MIHLCLQKPQNYTKYNTFVKLEGNQISLPGLTTYINTLLNNQFPVVWVPLKLINFASKSLDVIDATRVC